MSFKINPYLIVLIVSFICYTLFYCNGKGERDILKKAYSELESQNQKLESENNKLFDDYSKLEDSIKQIQAIRDTVIEYRVQIREVSNKAIEEAKSLSEQESEKEVWINFNSFKDINVFKSVADSNKLELKINKNLLTLQKKENGFLTEKNKKLESIVINKDEQLSLKDTKIEYKNLEIKATKKKWFKIGLATGAGGVLIGRALLSN